MSEQLLKEILGELKNVNQRLGQLEEGQEQVTSKIDNLDARVGGLDTKVDSLNTRVGGLETKVDSLSTRVGGLETKVDGLNTRVGGLETRMDKMEANQLKLETRIENEVIDKIQVLFDAHSLYMDYFISIRDGQARIEENIELLTRRNTETLMKTLENEREIRLLRVEKKL